MSGCVSGCCPASRTGKPYFCLGIALSRWMSSLDVRASARHECTSCRLYSVGRGMLACACTSTSARCQPLACRGQMTRGEQDYQCSLWGAEAFRDSCCSPEVPLSRSSQHIAPDAPNWGRNSRCSAKAGLERRSHHSVHTTEGPHSTGSPCEEVRSGIRPSFRAGIDAQSSEA